MTGGVVLALAAGFFGCATPEPPAAVVRNPKYEDIPVPFNFRQDRVEPSQGQQHVAFRCAELHYIGSARVDRTADWYAAQMPKLNWALRNTEGGADNKRAVLTFTKGAERCVVTIEPKAGETAVVIRIDYQNAGS